MEFIDAQVMLLRETFHCLAQDFALAKLWINQYSLKPFPGLPGGSMRRAVSVEAFEVPARQIPSMAFMHACHLGEFPDRLGLYSLSRWSYEAVHPNILSTSVLLSKDDKSLSKRFRLLNGRTHCLALIKRF